VTSQPRNARCLCGSGRKYKLCHGKSESAKTGKPHKDEIAFIICTPTRGTMVLQTHLALAFNVKGVPQIQVTAERQPVIEARNGLARQAQIVAESFPFIPREFVVLWADDDAWWPEDTFPILSKMFRAETSYDAICGYFGPRMPRAAAAAFRVDGTWPRPGVDCVEGSVVPIVRAGFHFFGHRLSVLERLGPNPFGDERNTTSEDFYFCDRMTELGMRIGCATGMPVAHIDAKSGLAFIPGKEAMMATGNGLRATGYSFALPDGSVVEAERHSYGGALDALYDAGEREVARRRALAGLA